jgi:hypothetical protein
MTVNGALGTFPGLGAFYEDGTLQIRAQTMVQFA